MSIGDSSKFHLARQLVAGLAYIALADLDRIAVIAYADGIIADLPVTRGKGRILSVMKFLESVRPGGQDTNLEAAVKGLLHRGARTGLAVVISDLFDEHGFQRGLDQLRYRQFDAHVIQLHDPAEADPAILGDAELVDVETQSVRRVTVTERSLAAYRQLFAKHQAAVREYCHSCNLGCTQSSSTLPFDELILRMMRESSTGR